MASSDAREAEMKPISLLMCALFVAGIVLGQLTPVLAGQSKHEFSAEVVSIDLDDETITFLDTHGDEMTMRVMGDALETLATLAAGDKVILTCEDDENGEHMGIVSIDADKTERGGS
jgi:hypothetical protein